MTKVSWQEHFKKTLEGAEQAYSAQGPVHSPVVAPIGFLAYCLNENLIPAQEYLEWAKEAHQIPLLLDEYFLANSPSKQVFQSSKSVYRWNPFCLPLTEWDGVLMIACLEVPTNFPAGIPVAFLLASPSLMAQTWEYYAEAGLTSYEDVVVLEAASRPPLASIEELTAMDATVSREPAAEAIDLPVDLLKPKVSSVLEPTVSTVLEPKVSSVLEPKVSTVLNPKVSSALNPKIDESSASTALTDSLEALLADSNSAPKTLFDANGELLLKDEESQVISGSNPSIQTEEISAGMPEGLFAETAVDTAPLKDFNTSTLTLNTLKSASQEAIRQAPAENDLDSTKTATAHFDLETKTISMEESLSVAVPVPAAAAAPAPVQVLTKGPRSVEPLGPVASAEDIAALDNSGLHRAPPVSPQASAAMPKAPVKSTTPHGMEAAYLLEKIRKHQPELFDKETKNTLRLLKPYFKKAMLLAIGDKDRVFKPLIWDDNFALEPSAKLEFELKTPSAFRIVSTTQKPYHGFVTPNEIHDAFFAALNQSPIPENITIVPFFDGDHVVGNLLWLGEKNSYTRPLIKTPQINAKELATRVFKLTNTPATQAANPAAPASRKSVA
jgi:hypothetical protein